MKLRPYWLDTAPAFTGGAQGPPDGSCDVAVIGAGFTGLSAALALARQGAQVAVLDSGPVVGAASGRNGGHCNNGLSQDVRVLAAKLGLERTRQLYHVYDAAVDTVERLVAEHRIDCGFRRSGKLRLAAKPGHYAQLAKTHEVLARDIDPETELIPAAELGREIGSPRFHGALLHTRSALLHVGRFGVGLAAAAAGAGARIFEHAEVTGLKPLAGGRHQVTTARGELRAAQVLLATGAYTTGPFGYFQRRIVPVGSFVIATAPLPAAQLDAVLPRRRTAVTTRIIGNYFRASDDGRLIFGGRARAAPSSPQSDRRSGLILARALTHIFPQLDGVQVDHCWGGLVDMTADRLPRAGQQDGLYYALGYSGHGVQMSVHMGQLMAQIMAGRVEANPWRELDWAAVPGHFGKPWFLPLVGAWYRLLDLAR